MTSAIILLCLLFTGVNCLETYTAILGSEMILEPPKKLYRQDFIAWHETSESKNVLFVVREGQITDGPQVDNRISLTISSQKVTLSLKNVKESDTGLYRFELLPETKERIEFYVKVQHSTARPTLPSTRMSTRTTKKNQYFSSSTTPKNSESSKFSKEIQLTLIICLTIIVITIAVVVTVVCVCKMKGKDEKDLELNCPSQPPSHSSPHSDYYPPSNTKCPSCSTYTSRSATPHSSHHQQAQDSNSFTGCSRIQSDYHSINIHGSNSSKIVLPEVFKTATSNGFKPITVSSNQSPHSHV